MNINFIPIPLFTIIDGIFKDMNSAFSGLLGFNKDELLNTKFLNIVSPYSQSKAESFINTDNNVPDTELKIIKKNGEECWIHLTINKQKLDDKDCILGFANDITKYKDAIEKLELMEAQYADILDNMGEEVSKEDPQGKVIYVNNAYSRFYGIPKEEAIGRQGIDVVIPEDRSKYDVIKMLTPENPFYKLDCRVWSTNGEIAWIQCTGKAFFNQNRQLIECQEVGRDVTEIKNKQEALALLKEQLELSVAQKTKELTVANHKLSNLSSYLDNILQNVSEGVAVIDEKGYCERTNSLLEKTWGEQLHDLMKDFGKIIVENPNSPLGKMIFKRKPFKDQEIILEREGRNIHCMVSGAPLTDEEGSLRRGVIIIRDITEVHLLVNRMSGFYARFTFDDIITQSPIMIELKQYAKDIANNRMNVMIEGESGTGKELFAQAIHNESVRRKGPFVAVNCGALPSELIGSELFGYTEGSFTGAKKGGKPGKFELASGGTLFLDEIGDMPLVQQATLLRVLQEKKIIRIGGESEIPVDVRVICATNKNLYREVEKGNFRQDLYYRLNVLHIKVPALRDRLEDIPLLIHYFANEHVTTGEERKKLRAGTLTELEKYSWPGNVRELQNLVERSVYLSQENEFTIELREKTIESAENSSMQRSYSECSKSHSSNRNKIPDSFDLHQYRDNVMRLLEEQEKEHIISLMKLFDSNISLVARKMNISRNTLYKKLNKYKLL